MRADLPRESVRGRWDRPELHRLLDQLRKGDVLIVWKLDRLSRSLRDVLTIMQRLGEAKAGFLSLTEAIDTTTRAGRMMMQMVAEFERAMLRERTKAGLDAPVKRAGSAAAARSFPPSSSPRFGRWLPGETRLPQTPPGCSRSTRLRSCGCWLGLRRQHQGGGLPAPNSMQSLTPNKLQSDRRLL